ncbi:MAG: SDR family NAD(P)-dependent oxidoreductase, partial [Caldisericia bacterium]|nr:SDR family NAD(P)-dependent oxidoreductase [Caldisericia bacterium]
MNAYKYKFKTKINLVTKFVYDLFCFTISSYLAFFIRFDFSFDVLVNYLDYLKIASVIELILGFMIVHIYKTYKDIWQYTSINEIFKLIKATILEKLIFSIIILSLSLEGFPRSIFLISPITAFTLLVVPRLFIRLSREERNGGKKGENNTLIVGAGDAGEKIIREIKAHSHLGYNVVGFVDDNPAKYGCYLQGVKVLGDTYSIPNLVKELSIKSILIAIPTAKREEIKRIYDSISGLPVKLLILPGIYEIIGGNVTISHLRPFGLSDLLFREQVKLITEKSIKKFNNSKVLVTGACGSIGSEICRSLVDLGAKVIAYDNNETGIFDLEKELSNSIVPIVGDIRFKEKLKAVLDEYKPSVVFHAAAYKHVPLMEILPEEAVINNIIGTLNVVEACAESKISQCVIISTDKAVEPKNIMG